MVGSENLAKPFIGTAIQQAMEIQTFQEDAEAFRLANDTPYGLAHGGFECLIDIRAIGPLIPTRE